jgi:hypothetical protein
LDLSFQIQSCAQDSLISCELQKNANDYLVTVKTVVTVQVNIMIQSSDEQARNTGERLLKKLGLERQVLVRDPLDKTPCGRNNKPLPKNERPQKYETIADSGKSKVNLQDELMKMFSGSNQMATFGFASLIVLIVAF